MSDDAGPDSDGEDEETPPAEGPAPEEPDDEGDAKSDDGEATSGETATDEPEPDEQTDHADGEQPDEGRVAGDDGELSDDEADDGAGGDADDEGSDELGEEWGPSHDEVVQGAEAIDLDTDTEWDDESGGPSENDAGSPDDGEGDGERSDDVTWEPIEDEDVVTGDEFVTGEGEEGQDPYGDDVPYTGPDGESGIGDGEPPEHGPARSGEQRDPDGEGGELAEHDARDATAAGHFDGDATGGAPDDEEMPLTQHIEEMVGRLLVVIAIVAAVAIVTLFYSDELINFLWYSFLDGPKAACPNPPGAMLDPTNAVNPDCPHLYHPLALVLARLKVATLVGFIVALPAFVYETYLFMRPGLYPHERRYYLAAVPTSLVLAAIGVAFAYFAVLRSLFAYFISYSRRAAELAFGLSSTFDLILLLLGAFALIFQIPLFIMLAIMMDVTSRQWLEDRRIYFWGGFAGIAFIFSPDPTGMAPVMVAATMIVLFEGTLLLLRWTGR